MCATWETRLDERSLLSTPSFGGRSSRASEGLIVPMKPGNAGGGKEPCFWSAFDEAKERGLA